MTLSMMIGQFQRFKGGRKTCCRKGLALVCGLKTSSTHARPRFAFQVAGSSCQPGNALGTNDSCPVAVRTAVPALTPKIVYGSGPASSIFTIHSPPLKVDCPIARTELPCSQHHHHHNNAFTSSSGRRSSTTSHRPGLYSCPPDPQTFLSWWCNCTSTPTCSEHRALDFVTSKHPTNLETLSKERANGAKAAKQHHTAENRIAKAAVLRCTLGAPTRADPHILSASICVVLELPLPRPSRRTLNRSCRWHRNNHPVAIPPSSCRLLASHIRHHESSHTNAPSARRIPQHPRCPEDR